MLKSISLIRQQTHNNQILILYLEASAEPPNNR